MNTDIFIRGIENVFRSLNAKDDLLIRGMGPMSRATTTSNICMLNVNVKFSIFLAFQYPMIQ